MDRKVFAYGTLMFPEILTALLGRVPGSYTALLKGYRRAAIRDRARAAKGPAIAKSRNAHVRGVLLTGLSEREYRIVCFYEDAATGYDRSEESVELTNGKTVRVSLFVATGSTLPKLSRRDWSEKTFREKHLVRYVDERIPALLRGWNAKGTLTPSPPPR